ncbi:MULTISPECIES: cytochrome c oxidase subunit I [Roseivirga]|jgi:cytochrome c oxidase subunit 1|uniref:Cytochrome-c oxidase n=1 Tax=Roseivirga thermotolerans TaxID=1758176 RepID=A0ABQ3I687_9BACT|nr:MULTISPECIES: cbb3-type cytochrome c oxidase subunit I [Roseivirga]MEC7752388.1 cbb3-type cytochrome c oxidase subunit I [Bacteroidota bacterium]GHE67864.1 cytochrome-c oxidase [Roseivirga thermotolerans]|tara:strand:+ start:3311 stop:5191 length:1881 start_codon:yes stop_codon:yes gene_type:complete
MATAAEAHIDVHGHDDHHDHDHEQSFISKYIFSTDHKTIAKQFLITGIIWAVIGAALSAIFRLQLGFPEADLGWLRPLLGKWISPEGTLDPEFYLALVTMHGTIMVFFVLTAGLSGTFSNYLIPLQIGARDMASGFMNMLSYWFFFVSSVIMLISLFIETGPASGGWVVYPPLSALPEAMSGSGLGMTLWLVAMVFFIASSLLGGINYVSTVINLRTKGMTFSRLPLTIWAFFLTAVIGILSFPVLFAAALLLVFDRSFGTSFYLSEIYINGEALPNVGGSPILYQHLFWFLGHPEVYIVLLPALGITSEIIATNSRKPIFGYKAMIISMMGITFLSFIVWAHHMFVSGLNPFLGSIFMFLTLIIAVPSAVKVFNYLTTLWKGNIVFTPAMLFSIGLVSVFISGGITGIFLGNSAIDIQLHDTYFVVAHFHLVMGAASSFGLLAGVYHWFPKMFGRMMDARLGYIHFWLTFIGIYSVFFPMHYIGIAGFPRRYYSFTNFDAFSGFTDLNMFISIAAIATFIGQFIFLFNFFYSIFRGRKAPANPWKSTTLEWTTPRVPGHGNWPGEIPKVYRWAYDYSKPGAEDDFIPQTVPFSQTMESNLPHENDMIALEKEMDAEEIVVHEAKH